MKESHDKENSGLNPEDEDIESIVKRFEEKLDRDGIPHSRGNLKDEYTIILNPPQSLVERMRKAKQEEAAKKKK